MRRLVTLTIAVSLHAVSLGAQSRTSPDSLLEHFIGSWVLEGPLAGQQVTHDVTVAWVLGHEYVQLHEVSRELTSTGTPAYEAIVYIVWDPKTQQYLCLWLDSTEAGSFQPLGRAVPAADSIPFVFEYSNTDRFHNTFVYDRGTDTWQWHLDNDQAGVRRVFARVTLRRR
jgi:hypothetical protein